MNTDKKDVIAADKAVRTPGGGFNTPISKRELQQIGEQFPGQRLTIITAKHPNRQQRRAQYQGDKVNNRKLTHGRVVYRAEMGAAIPQDITIGKRLKKRLAQVREFLKKKSFGLW